MEEQMEKNLWCKIERKMCRFIQHIDNKERWICCSCGFETTKPLKIPPRVNRPKHYFSYI